MDDEVKDIIAATAVMFVGLLGAIVVPAIGWIVFAFGLVGLIYLFKEYRWETLRDAIEQWRK